MSEEKKIILTMLKEGKINIDEAEKLLNSHEEAVVLPEVSKSINRKFLKVFVAEENNTKVNINIPLALAEIGLKLVPTDKLKIGGNDVDVDEILKLAQEGNVGELVNINAMDKGKEVKVRICIE